MASEKIASAAMSYLCPFGNLLLPSIKHHIALVFQHMHCYTKQLWHKNCYIKGDVRPCNKAVRCLGRWPLQPILKYTDFLTGNFYSLGRLGAYSPCLTSFWIWKDLFHVVITVHALPFPHDRRRHWAILPHAKAAGSYIRYGIRKQLGIIRGKCWRPYLQTL